ncbi:MAG: acetyl-CoA carboxylase biotin carboxyl carrier protein [Vallitalea sp.]|jgi:acetyl-CoA carboxylase biotin carboxyl carrier protein|nr:acetyl-CoA carboxylase biotin carboxyl carrier protein [Vallitalea sp.]
MNTQDVLQLINVLKETGYQHISIKHEGLQILLTNNNLLHRPVEEPIDAKQELSSIEKHNKDERATNIENETTIGIQSKQEENEVEGHVVESPIVGTFYSAASPDDKDFVTVGSKVKKGDVLCIIEAMKLMNEIDADQDGEILKILVENEQGVEFGQPLFIIG